MPQKDVMFMSVGVCVEQQCSVYLKAAKINVSLEVDIMLLNISWICIPILFG